MPCHVITCHVIACHVITCLEDGPKLLREAELEQPVGLRHPREGKCGVEYVLHMSRTQS
jgi:hypothetical protein